MLSTEKYIEEGSDYYIYTPSQTAKEMFFYPVCTGFFRYKPQYMLKRARYDSFLLMAVSKGHCHVKTKDFEEVIGESEVMLLDCYEEHEYDSDVGWEAFWLHFDGRNSRQYYEYIVKQRGNKICLERFQVIEQELKELYHIFKSKKAISEPYISLKIVNILTEFMNTKTKADMVSDNMQDGLSETIRYLHEHFAENLSLKQLSKMCSLSPYYFTRVFTKMTGQTPHQYLIEVRINSAKFLLKNTNMSMKEIGFACGFTSESSFNATFKKKVGVSPGRYR